jgi:hypothetical protein
MIKKIISLLVISMMLTSTAFALSETTEGPKHITVCYAIGTDAMTSGNVVVLTDAGDTTRTIEHTGREVTGNGTTAGNNIYGVVVDNTNYSALDMIGGKWIRVQTHGYCPTIRLADGASVTRGTSHLVTSATNFRAIDHATVNFPTGRTVITGNIVGLTNKTTEYGHNSTTDCYIGHN